VGERFERWILLDLVIDAGAQTVARGDTAVLLPKLSFQFLLELVRAAPNVLSVDDLMERVWPGIFVNVETVTQRAKLLRDALGDNPKEPRYFVARRGIGYQLLAAPVSLPKPGLANASAHKPTLWMALFAALTLAAGVGGVVYERHVSLAVKESRLRVAVLPFENLSSDPSDAYIARGIPEMVLNRLSSVSGLTVISRESALLSKIANAAPAESGRQLHVDYVVKGTVQRQGGTLRVTAFVLDTAKGARLWSESYDWPIDRVYALQDKIAGHVAQSLEGETRGLGPVPPTAAPSRNSDAYLAYLRGKSLIGRYTVAETDAAAQQFERAIRFDPQFAPAMIALFDARMQGADLRKDDLGRIRAKMMPLLDKAMRIDPNSGEAFFAKAMWVNIPRDERLELFRRAASLDPSNARGLTAFAQFLGGGALVGVNDVMGDGSLTGDSPSSGERERLLNKVLSIDPLNQHARFVAIQQKLGELTPEQVEEEQRKALQLDPGNQPLVNRYANRRWMFHGESAEAIAILEPLIASDPQNPWGPHVVVPIYLDANDAHAARTVAETTPASRDSTRAILAQYRGDWRTAGEAALGPRGFLFNIFQNWLWAESVRDYALHTKQYDRGAEAIASRYGFDLSNPRTENLPQSDAAPKLAHILIAAGKRQAGERLLAQTIQWIDAHPRYGLVGVYRSRAAAMMLLGVKDQALSNLKAVIETGHERRIWWYLIEHDPVWEPVHNDPRFREIADFCRRAAREQRAKLDLLRRQGKVPVRQART
jgi:TolB-like protein/DNA-binding winged helix-turn-helix (wHTH) protein